MAQRQDASTGDFVDDGKPEVLADNQQKDQSGLQIKVYSPFRTYYNDVAESISAVNQTGPFDILPQHHSFISLLEPCEMILATASGTQKIKIAGGIMHVRKNRVSVLLDV
jgi:F0F1-type ATP synthase epsilon subunit